MVRGRCFILFFLLGSSAAWMPHAGFLNQQQVSSTTVLFAKHGQNRNTMSPTPMDQAAASRIQGAQARANQGEVAAGSFAARAQSAAARNMGKRLAKRWLNSGNGVMEHDPFVQRLDGMWVWAGNGRAVDRETASNLMKAEATIWGKVSRGSLAARAQSLADQNVSVLFAKHHKNKISGVLTAASNIQRTQAKANEGKGINRDKKQKVKAARTHSKDQVYWKLLHDCGEPDYSYAWCADDY